MCGIAAFSIPNNARVNARQLAHVLLKQIEKRGSHASGFAYYGKDGAFNFYKNPVPGSQLSLGELPRDAKTVILHTRYATQGDARDNRNNHPVISTDNQVALVHNGVISNDYRLREGLGITSKHGEVDSLVIPSMISQKGVEGLSALGGYAAIAWMDARQNGELHIARLKQSPVAYTHLIDGTFVMASTPQLLTAALDETDHFYGGVFEMPEGKLMSVHHGFIYDYGRAPSMTYDSYAYSRHSNATSGGHGTGKTPTTPPPAVSRSGNVVFEASKGSEDSCSMAMAEYNAEVSEHDGMTDEDWDYGPTWDEMIARLEEEEYNLSQIELRDLEWENEDDDAEPNYSEGFYILDGEGDITHHPILEDLEARLRFMARQHKGGEYDIFQVADELNWVNQIMDLGHIDEKGKLISWVDDTGMIDDFESPAVHNLRQVREGAQMLAQLKGA